MSNVTTLSTKKAPAPVRVFTDAHLAEIAHNVGADAKGIELLRSLGATAKDIDTFWSLHIIPVLLGQGLKDARDYMYWNKASGTVAADYNRRRDAALAAERLAASADDLRDVA